MPEINLEEAMDKVKNMVQFLARSEQRVTDAANLMDECMATIAAKAKMGDAVDLTAEVAQGFREFEDALKKLRNQVARMKEVHMPNRFDDEGVTSFTTDKFRVTRTARTFASIVAEDKEDAFEWLRENDYGGLIKETVNSSSLSAVAKELLENGRELPDELFRTHNKDNVSVTVKKQNRG